MTPKTTERPRAVSFTICGAPRTKKNHSIISTKGNYPRLLPSPQFAAWNRIAQIEMARLRSAWPSLLSFAAPVNVCAAFYRDAERGDAVGYYQALADALEEAGIVENDRLIVSWDGSRLLKDAKNPRIEVTLEAV